MRLRKLIVLGALVAFVGGMTACSKKEENATTDTAMAPPAAAPTTAPPPPPPPADTMKMDTAKKMEKK
jgi:hypothetical protein